MKKVLFLIKLLPIIMNIYIVMIIGSVLFYPLSNNIYLIFGHSIITDSILLYLSYHFKLCKWHKILCINLIIMLIGEYITNNFIKEEFYIHSIIIMFIIITMGIICALCTKIINDVRKKNNNKKFN